MTLDEIKAKLDAKVLADAEAEKKKLKRQMNEYNKQVARLKEIQPRVQRIIDAYAYAKSVGLGDLFRKNHVRSNWSLMAEGFYHYPGIMRDNNFMGIYAGGDCGPWNFFVNGHDFFFHHEDEKAGFNIDYPENHVGTIRNFCDEFEEYETAFYKLIKSL